MRQSALDDYQSSGDSGPDPGETYRDEDWLRREYVARGRTTYDLAAECGVTDGTISKWLNRHGIEARGPDCYHTPDGATETYRDEAWLREQYIVRGRTTYDIAAECGVTKTTICDWLDRHGIGPRTSDDANSPTTAADTYRDEDWLRREYAEQERKMTDIAAECGVVKTTIRNWLDRHGIPTRDSANARLRAGGADPDETYRDRDWLHEQYVENRRTAADIAAECGVSESVVGNWLRRHDGIETRSGEPLDTEYAGLYDTLLAHDERAWDDARRETRERDGHTCQNPTCDRTAADSPWALDVHHIVPVVAGGPNSDRNLLTLCRMCHGKAEAFTRDLGIFTPLTDYAEPGDLDEPDPTLDDGEYVCVTCYLGADCRDRLPVEEVVIDTPP